MLYLFWHWTQAGVDQTVYTARLARFQEELEAAGPGTGLDVSPVSFVASAAPGLIGAGTPLYLDAYLMAGTPQLAALNLAAVTGEPGVAHAQVARLAGGGAGALYQPFRGSPVRPDTWQVAYWFAKPDGMTYDSLAELLNTIPGQFDSLQRFMVLGPNPEFVLFATADLTIPGALTATRVNLTSL